MDSTRKELVVLYQQMADHTKGECAQCFRPFSCCSTEYCEMAIGIAKERGVELIPTGHSKLPLMGENGCVAPPHFRPLCTLHTCEVNSLGFKRNDSDGSWTDKYFDLRGKIEDEEYKSLE